MNDIEKAIEDLKDINTILKTQHMCKVLDDELTKKDAEDYKSRFASVNLAISALEKQLNGGWIPVSERLPEDIKGNGLVTVLACLKSKDDSLFFSDNTVYQEVTDYITDTQEWEIDNGYEVLAWRPLPEPYKEVEH